MAVTEAYKYESQAWSRTNYCLSKNVEWWNQTTQKYTEHVFVMNFESYWSFYCTDDAFNKSKPEGIDLTGILRRVCALCQIFLREALSFKFPLGDIVTPLSGSVKVSDRGMSCLKKRSLFVFLHTDRFSKTPFPRLWVVPAFSRHRV
jgi:hypothetical protein